MQPGDRPRVFPADQRRPRARRGVGGGLGAADDRARSSSRPEYQFADVLQREVLLVVGAAAADDASRSARRFRLPWRVATADAKSPSPKTSASSTRSTRSARFSDRCSSGFVLIPQVGLHGTIRLVAGAIVASRSRRPVAHPRARRPATARRPRGWLCAGRRGGGGDRRRCRNGIARCSRAARTSTRRRCAGRSLETALTAGELLSYREGSTGTVAVRRLAGTISLAIDGKVDASNAGDMLTQRLLAHVPLLLHPNPQRAAILGLGSGVTLGSALTHPLTEVHRAGDLARGRRGVAVFRSREPSRARRSAHAPDRRRRPHAPDARPAVVRRDRLGAVEPVDGRHRVAVHARVLRRRARSADARRRVVPVGAHLRHQQQRPASRLSPRSCRSSPTARCGWSAMPTCCWWDRPSRSTRASAASRDAMQRGPGVAADLAGVGVTGPFSVTSLFVAQGDALEGVGQRRAAADRRSIATRVLGPAQHLRQRPRRQCRGAARAGGVEPEAAGGERGARLGHARRLARSRVDVPEGRRPSPGLRRSGASARQPTRTTRPRSMALIRAAASLNRIGDAQSFLARLASDPAHMPAKLALSRVLASQGNIDEAIRIPFSVLQANPANVAGARAAGLGAVRRWRRRAVSSRWSIRLVKEAPKSAWSHYYAASLFFLQNRHDLALQAARNAVAIDPAHAKAHNLIGACLATMGQPRRGADRVRDLDQGRPARAGHLHQPRDPRAAGRQPRPGASATSPKRSRSIPPRNPPATDSHRSAESDQRPDSVDSNCWRAIQLARCVVPTV